MLLLVLFVGSSREKTTKLMSAALVIQVSKLINPKIRQVCHLGLTNCTIKKNHNQRDTGGGGFRACNIQKHLGRQAPQALHNLSVKVSVVLKLCLGECKWVVGQVRGRRWVGWWKGGRQVGGVGRSSRKKKLDSRMAGQNEKAKENKGAGKQRRRKKRPRKKMRARQKKNY